nr:hypothetical protein GCM10020092_097920 [Actinoplanes digitatis]
MRPLARRRPIATVLITLFAFAFESTFFAWLLSSIEVPDPRLHTWLYAATVVMIVATALIELFRLVNVVTLCLATLWARDPVPMVPDRALRVAFLTTIVPGKEPVDMVERTLRAARAIRHAGRYDVWLLDEGDDDQVRQMCRNIGVQHFSRKGRPEYNTPHRRLQSQDQTRQLQLLGRRQRRPVRRLRLRRPRPRTTTQLLRTTPRLLPRPRRRLRRRPTDLRQLRQRRDPLGRITAIPLPLPAPAR